MLLCELTYKQDWDLPGGVVEVGESPQLAVAREVEGMVVGAGTVVTPEQVQQVKDAGAQFVVTPGSPPRLLDAALASGLPLLAGALIGLLVWIRGRDEHYAGLTPGLTPGVDKQVPVVV